MKHLKDLRFVLPLGLQGIDVSFDGRRGFGRGSHGRGLGFCGANVLRARVRYSWGTPGVVAFVGAVAFLPAAEAKSFLDASRSFRGSKFREGDGVNVHSVGVMGSARGRKGRRKSSPFQCEDAHLLRMEYLGLFNPFGDGGRDRGHGEDHGSELLVKSQGKLVDKGNVVRDTCL